MSRQQSRHRFINSFDKQKEGNKRMGQDEKRVRYKPQNFPTTIPHSPKNLHVPHIPIRCLVSLFNGISTFVGYLMPSQSHPCGIIAVVLFNQ